MDSQIIAARALAAGDLLGVLNRVALRTVQRTLDARALVPSPVAPIKTSAQFASKPQRNILTPMATITEVEKLALDLPESQRAVLATRLLRSLSPVLHDEDEGIAEAFLRDADLDTT
jgi:hypothetical protein